MFKRVSLEPSNSKTSSHDCITEKDDFSVNYLRTIKLKFLAALKKLKDKNFNTRKIERKQGQETCAKHKINIHTTI